MGVPALFRWLSRKYPKIVSRVIEETPTRVRDDSGEIVEVPVRYEGKNPNGFEVDNLYLDMNGIVHPCTHPEGKPAPETEEDMMVEVFNYTERVVNMTRPRKVLMMAIDGVAPRAKMNQQRSRRFRAAQEAAEKEVQQEEAIKLFEAMGHTVSNDARKKAWDSNAITPGTPFMDLLSASLKYWVSYKMSTDPGWKDLKVIISDSSVPGEGEHKIVDWIRRQRTYPDWDPNTSHVIYGLDADLIMLSLATHEPHFRVLREDVFFQGSKEPQTCKKCEEPGHIAANCKGEKVVKDPTIVEKAKPVDPKPFIFLDVSILREYLAVELNLPGLPFPFNLELAIDDWIFLIFFVGNDFLPHLPSLEIREGAIDTLLKIWRAELPRMGGYLTNHGKVAMDRAQIILEGLAKSEDEIFQKRKEDEERQESREKRRRIDEHRRQDDAKAAREAASGTSTPGTMTLNGTEYVDVTPSATARGGALHPGLPSRPADSPATTDVASAAAAVPVKGGKKMSAAQREAASLNQGGNQLLEAQASNKDVFENRRKIRMANLSAAQALKAELAGDAPAQEESSEEKNGGHEAAPDAAAGDNDMAVEADSQNGKDENEEDGENGHNETEEPRGTKRKAEEDPSNGDEDEASAEDEDDEIEAPPNPEADQPVPKKKLKVNPDGTVDGYVDEVRLWEPGYRERYYQSKFGVPLTDTDFIAKVTRCYMEGLCWVLEYYYQGVPAWDWYYPYHYAPFAQDFKDVGKMDIQFEASKPFTPFGQLLGVFPAASRIHLPAPLQTLMIDDESPIIDFYPSDFEIDMNGKKMAWQGVALLPFIDQTRLLDALASKLDLLTDDEKRRNKWGDNVMFIAEANQLFDSFCQLYTIKPPTTPVAIDSKLSLGTNGAVLGDPACVPNSGYDSPLVNIPQCPDIENNQSISVRYYFPRQAHTHRSVILPGYRPGPPQLTESDKERTRRGDVGGGRGGGRGGRGGFRGGPGMGGGGHRDFSGPRHNGRDSGAYGGHQDRAPPSGGYYAPPPPQPAYGGYGYGGSGGGGSYAAAPPSSSGYGGYGGGGGGSYGGQNHSSYGRSAPPPPRGGGYGGSGNGGGGYGGGYAPPPQNPYAAAPPPNPYGRQPNPYGAPPPSNGSYGGYGGYGNGARGGSQSGRGGYNPYGGRR